MASIHHHFLLPILLISSSFVIGESNLFMEYIGANFKNVKFSDVPINSGVNFNFILSFAIDYTTSSPAVSTNGNFNEFWDIGDLSPSDVAAIKSMHPNVKVSVSIGGDSVGNDLAYFKPTSVDSWVTNAVSSLTNIIKRYNLDGIDIDYEHFSATSDVFAECIGQLITKLKENGVISFASIAPFDNDDVQRYYQALWSKYNRVIDYVNFQFYAYDKSTTVAQFLDYYNTQTMNYDNGKVLVSFNSDGSRGLMPENGFFDACRRLKLEGKLHGIFIWCADNSKVEGFKYEIQSQEVLTA